MGASWFEITAYGKSLREAYDNAVKDAEEESGHDSYNGTISTTHTIDDLTDQFRRSKKGFDEYVKMQQDKLHKRDCAGICILDPIVNKNKTKSQVEHVVTPGTKHWILKYEVENYFEDGVIASCMTKGDAVKMARAYTEKHQKTTRIVMRKVLNKVDPTVAKITYKKSTTERAGKYILFGWAAE
jgi:hypothetical protein